MSVSKKAMILAHRKIGLKIFNFFYKLKSYEVDYLAIHKNDINLFKNIKKNKLIFEKKIKKNVGI